MSEAANLDDYRSSLNPKFLRAVRERRNSERAAIERKARQEQLAKMRAEAKAAQKPAEVRRIADMQRHIEDVARRHEAIAKEREAAFTPFERIEAMACRVFDVWPSDLRVGNMRTKQLVMARHFVCYWARRRCGLSTPDIGRKFGGRDHTTVLHGAAVYPKKRAKMGRTLRGLA